LKRYINKLKDKYDNPDVQTLIRKIVLENKIDTKSGYTKRKNKI